jgi:hypothetical protein
LGRPEQVESAAFAVVETQNNKAPIRLMIVNIGFIVILSIVLLVKGISSARFKK